MLRVANISAGVSMQFALTFSIHLMFRGKGEIEDGMFDDDGPGWTRYPQIKKALNPVVADDGIFWVTKEEFFVFFATIYLSASDMTAFLED